MRRTYHTLPDEQSLGLDIPRLPPVPFEAGDISNRRRSMKMGIMYPPTSRPSLEAHIYMHWMWDRKRFAEFCPWACNASKKLCNEWKHLEYSRAHQAFAKLRKKLRKPTPTQLWLHAHSPSTFHRKYPSADDAESLYAYDLTQSTSSKCLTMSTELKQPERGACLDHESKAPAHASCKVRHKVHAEPAASANNVNCRNQQHPSTTPRQQAAMNAPPRTATASFQQALAQNIFHVQKPQMQRPTSGNGVHQSTISKKRKREHHDSSTMTSVVPEEKNRDPVREYPALNNLERSQSGKSRKAKKTRRECVKPDPTQTDSKGQLRARESPEVIDLTRSPSKKSIKVSRAVRQDPSPSCESSQSLSQSYGNGSVAGESPRPWQPNASSNDTCSANPGETKAVEPSKCDVTYVDRGTQTEISSIDHGLDGTQGTLTRSVEVIQTSLRPVRASLIRHNRQERNGLQNPVTKVTDSERGTTGTPTQPNSLQLSKRLSVGTSSACGPHWS